jgi:hypothetical protein
VALKKVLFVSHNHPDLLVGGVELYLRDAAPPAIELTGPRGATRVAERIERPDVAAFYEGIPGALHAGFAAILPPDEFLADGRWDFTLRARSGDETRFRCRITRPRFSYDGVEMRPSHLGDDGILHL